MNTNPSHFIIMPDLNQTITDLHRLYCRVARRENHYNTANQWQWEAWTVHGWTAEDLKIVIRFIQVRIKQQRRREESLRLHLLLDPDRFRDDLHDARVMFQKPRPATVVRDTVVNGTHRALPQPRPVRTAADILAGMKAAEEFSKLKQIL